MRYRTVARRMRLSGLNPDALDLLFSRMRLYSDMDTDIGGRFNEKWVREVGQLLKNYHQKELDDLSSLGDYIGRIKNDGNRDGSRVL